MKTYAKSLDTLGFFAREANDLALIRAAYGHAPADPPTQAPRIGFCPHPWWDMAERYNQKNIEDAVKHPARGRRQGARLGDARELGRPDPGAQPRHDQGSDASYGQERARFSHLLSPSMRP